MRHITAFVIFVATVFAMNARSPYELTEAKAARFFDAREWASAQALYGIMLDQRPDVASTYVHAIIASSMLGDTIAASHLLSESMKAGVNFSRLMAGVKTTAFEIGEAGVYEDFLFRSQRDCPWLERAIDDELLRYFSFRNDGVMMVRYAIKMLSGLPESTAYLSVLARGHALSGDFAGAVAVWKRIVEISPDDYDALLNLGNYYDLTGDTDLADKYLSKAQSLHATPFVASRIALLDGVKKMH